MKHVSHNGFESYLLELKKLLVGNISERVLTELLYDLNLHFHDLSADFQDEGLSRTESEKKALRVLGSPHRIARDYVKRSSIQQHKTTSPAIMALALPFLVAVLFSPPFMSEIRDYQVFNIMTVNEIAFLASIGIIFFTSLTCKKPEFRHLFVAIIVTCCYHFLTLAPLIVPGPNGTAFWRHMILEERFSAESTAQEPTTSFTKAGSFWIPTVSTKVSDSPKLLLTEDQRQSYSNQPFFSGTSYAIAQTWPTAIAIVLFLSAPHLLGVLVGNAKRHNRRRISAPTVSTSQPRA